MVQKYSLLFRNKVIQVGRELQKFADGDISYSEGLLFPETARNHLYMKVVRMEAEWRRSV